MKKRLAVLAAALTATAGVAAGSGAAADQLRDGSAHLDQLRDQTHDQLRDGTGGDEVRSHGVPAWAWFHGGK